MTHVGLRLTSGLMASVLAGAVGPAFAQATQVQPPSQEPSAEVQQVREELAQLRAEFDRLRQAYDERLASLEHRLAQLGGGPSVLPPPDPTVPDELDVPVALEQRPPPSSSQVFNPDTSVIGNFVTTAGKNPFSDESSLSLEEVEVAFQAIVDPYSRADFYIAAGPEGVEVEEGFLTLTALPARMLLKVGKLRAQFGKMNTLHTHRVPGVDRPLVSTNLLGGREGLSDAGLSLSHLVLNPALFLELTGEVFAGNSSVFQSSDRSKLNYLGRVRAYRDLTEATNIDLGASFAFGPANLAGENDRAYEKEEAQAEDHGELEAFGPQQAAVWHRRDAALPSSARRALPAPESGHGAGVEPPGPSRGRTDNRVRPLRAGRVPICASLVRRRPGRPVGEALRWFRGRHRRCGVPDVLADRIQPGQRSVPTDQLP